MGPEGEFERAERPAPALPDLPAAPSGSRAVRAAGGTGSRAVGLRPPGVGLVFRRDGGVGPASIVMGLRGPMGFGMVRVWGWSPRDGGEGLGRNSWGWGLGWGLGIFQGLGLGPNLYGMGGGAGTSLLGAVR